RIHGDIQREPCYGSYAPSWIWRSGHVGDIPVTMGLVNSLGHWCRQFGFEQAHRRNSGTIILRPEIVQLSIGSAWWVRHFGQVIFPFCPRKSGGRFTRDEKTLCAAV